MPSTSETPATERHILLVGPYGVLGTGVIDAVAENPKWGITTAARRPPPTYRAYAAPPHISELAAFYDLPIAEPLAMSTVSEMSEKAPLWDSMVARYGLHATSYEQIANWAFVDWMLNFREETIQSTIKIRQAGFADCIDTHQSFRRQLTRLRHMRIIP